MRGFHFSLRWLFGVVSFVAVGCGVLFYANPFLSKLTFTAMLAILIAAIPAAIYHAGERRAFWIGVATFGFAYVWLTCGPSTLVTSSSATPSIDRTAFLTTGHSLLAVAFALLGGIIATHTFRRSRAGQTPEKLQPT